MKTAPTAGALRRSSATDVKSNTCTLAGEHARLLRDVRRRAASVVALLETRSWPHAELRTLTGFLRTAVLRQASDEEALLYPNGASAPFAELTAEHVQLYTLTEHLDQANATPGSFTELHELIEELLRVLEHHLTEEQAVLAALPEAPGPVPAAGDLVAGTQAWLPPANGPVLILLDAVPEERAVQICVERLLRLRPGQSAEIYSSHEADLQQVCQWIHGFDPTRYGLAHLPAGLTKSALQVTRRHAT
jgi:hypothetical protein